MPTRFRRRVPRFACQTVRLRPAPPIDKQSVAPADVAGLPTRRAKWRPTLPFYFVENLWIIVCVYVSPGRRTTVGKSGLFGESG